MKIKIVIFTLITLIAPIAADIFDVFDDATLSAPYGKDFFKNAAATLSDDAQTIIAHQIIKDKILLTAPLIKTLAEGYGPITWSPDGKQLASGSVGNTIKIWNTNTWQITQTLQGNGIGILSIAWSPDGTQLAVAYRNKIIEIWNTNTGQIIQTLRGHTYDVASVAWSPDGKQLASASWDKTIIIWDTNTWQITQTLQGHIKSVISVAWSPDSAELASGSSDKTIIIWDAYIWQRTQTLQEHNDISSVAWSPDGQQLASVFSNNKEIKIYDTNTWQGTQVFQEDTQYPISVAWSPDSKQLASASWNRTIKILTFQQPIISKQDWQNLSLKQALFLLLLHIKRPTFKHARKKIMHINNIHPKLTYEEVIAILDSFTPETKAKIIKEFNFELLEPQLTPHEHHIFWGW